MIETLIEKMKRDLLNTRKSKDLIQSKFLAALISDCEAQGKKSLREPTDTECIAIIKSWIKKANETLKARENHKSRFEIEVLTSYLPKQLTEDEINTLLCEVVEAADAAGDTLNMGDFMKIFKEKYNGQYDGKMLSSLVREFLSL